ncbi:MAG: DUF1232 domain-containing protein [Muribaculaceae bacterium]|nr:DUF1232 domain-containing protein [Muribaculaceae bacterium]MDE6007755.1 DUF1232 domain-containing protein [Muribaculaceae bacterium]MDE6793575.1 DUF1232 domain-containing protein [Muribaculaceae bacterium]
MNYNEYLPKALEFFKEKMNAFSDKFNQSDLMKKITDVAKKAGCTPIYYALLLYYALSDGEVPLSKKLIVAAALGYFITPLDFIPDLLPAGLADDGAILLYALNQIRPYIHEGTEKKARAKLHEWFGEQEVYNLPKF